MAADFTTRLGLIMWVMWLVTWVAMATVVSGDKVSFIPSDAGEFSLSIVSTVMYYLYI